MSKPTTTIERVKEDGINRVQIHIQKSEGTDVLLTLELQDFRSLEEEILRLNEDGEGDGENV
ncbi:hypothetical protein [Leptospira santarosai]|uniref:hypothetical protein n=1 Tax=Leptospira santarosai TaxID=28183 RepID=UPI0024AFF500|nr:hypothetical protein [Leptospira santarosai]MDI7213244.1 hypothetical protein [Leptospira santarosai]MDI7220365.1 hypothetical protein [Leptospira santarosai]